VDLNDDDTIGHVTTPIESDGATTLAVSTASGYLINGSVGVTEGGSAVGPDRIEGWSAIHVEETNEGGYRLLWKTDVGETYYEWILNDQGAVVGGNAVDNVAGIEAFYDVDLNDDDTIGHVTTPIESDGATTLAVSTASGYLINGSVGVTEGGSAVGPDRIEGWSAIHVEETNEGGYRLLWKTDVGETYYEWILNDQGAVVGGNAVDNVADVEIFYGDDIDGSGTTGPGEPRIAAQPQESVAFVDTRDWDMFEFTDETDADELTQEDEAELLVLNGAQTEALDTADQLLDLTVADLLEHLLPDDDQFLL
ncbi:hypothetical protein, partial [Ruegeria lacuscaerulensis]|uniref:hypothetical protein n=1 Tax=Ruegeria lacuscaerulensis TaxID=55218 RepID=UPI001BE3EB77